MANTMMKKLFFFSHAYDDNGSKCTDEKCCTRGS